MVKVKLRPSVLKNDAGHCKPLTVDRTNLKILTFWKFDKFEFFYILNTLTFWIFQTFWKFEEKNDASHCEPLSVGCFNLTILIVKIWAFWHCENFEKRCADVQTVVSWPSRELPALPRLSSKLIGLSAILGMKLALKCITFLIYYHISSDKLTIETPCKYQNKIAKMKNVKGAGTFHSASQSKEGSVGFGTSQHPIFMKLLPDHLWH